MICHERAVRFPAGASAEDNGRDISTMTGDRSHKRGHRGHSVASSEILTCEEVAEFLRVHVVSVRRWSRSGKLMAYKVGGRGDWRYREQDVLAFLYEATTDGKGQEEVMVIHGQWQRS